MSKIAYIDVETTGLDPVKNGLIQIGCILEVDGTVKERLNLKPGCFDTDIIVDSALKINNITREEISSYAYPGAIHQQLCNTLSKYVDKFKKADKFHFIGYNAKFDMDFMRAWFRKCGDKYFGSWFKYPYLDVMQLTEYSLIRRGLQTSDNKLNTIAKYFNIDISKFNLHNAMDDIEITRLIWKQIEKTLIVVDVPSPISSTQDTPVEEESISEYINSLFLKEESIHDSSLLDEQ